MNLQTDNIFCYHLRLTDKYNNPKQWTEDTLKTINEHAIFLDDLGKAGVLIFAGRTFFEPGDNRLFGIALIKTKGIETAQQLLASDPAVVAGIQQADIYPFSLAIKHFENIK